MRLRHLRRFPSAFKDSPKAVADSSAMHERRPLTTPRDREDWEDTLAVFNPPGDDTEWR